MKTNTLRNSTFLISALSILPHIFCCAIPAVAAMIALGTTVGLGASLAHSPLYNFINAYHTELLIIAVCGVVLSGILNLIAYRIDCHEAAHAYAPHGQAACCHHAPCAPKKLKSFRIFLLSCALLVLDIAWFATEELVLGLHHHSPSHAEAAATLFVPDDNTHMHIHH